MNNTPDRDALALRNEIAEMVDDYAAQVMDIGHDACNPWITADKIEAKLKQHYKSMAIEAVADLNIEYIHYVIKEIERKFSDETMPKQTMEDWN